MSDEKKAKILKEYKEDGLTIKELAEKHDVTESFVSRVVATSQADEQETMGSIMEDLAKIIREVSKTRKLDAVIRTFGSKNPDDLEELARILSQAGIPVPDVAFIVENWAAYRHTTVPEKLYARIKGEKLEDEEIDLKQLQKQRFHDLKSEMAMAQMEDTVERMRSRREGKNDDTPKYKRVTRMVAKTDKEGKVEKDEDGNPVLVPREEIVPYDSGSGGLDAMTMMLLMQQNQPKKDNSEVIGLIAALAPALITALQPKDNTELIALMMKQQSDMVAAMNGNKGDDGKVAELRIQHQETMAQMRLDGQQQAQERQAELLKIQQQMRERDLTDRMGGMIGGLERKLEDSQRDRNLSDRQLLISAQERVLERGSAEISRNLQQVGGQMHEVFRGLSQDRLEEKRHQRNMERLVTAQRLGKTETEVREGYEELVVPEVTDDEMLAELAEDDAAEELNIEDIPQPESELIGGE